MLRKVNLPHAVTGRLYLSGLPGRTQRFADALREMADEGIDKIVCLAEIAEVEREAPEYAAAIEVQSLPSAHHWFSIPDGGVPKDETAFVRMLMELVERLRNGSRTLVHCRAGFENQACQQKRIALRPLFSCR